MAICSQICCTKIYWWPRFCRDCPPHVQPWWICGALALACVICLTANPSATSDQVLLKDISTMRPAVTAPTLQSTKSRHQTRHSLYRLRLVCSACSQKGAAASVFSHVCVVPGKQQKGFWQDMGRYSPCNISLRMLCRPIATI